MYLVLFLKILGAMLAAFGMVCLWYLATELWHTSSKAVVAVIYDGSFDAERLGSLADCPGRRFFGSRRTAVMIMQNAELPKDIIEILKSNDVEVYRITNQE